MFAPIFDLSRRNPIFRFKLWTHRGGALQPSRPASTNDGEHYDRIASDPKYGHFARIPARILRCLDYFHVTCDQITAARILSAYYIFIAVVDNAIDSGDSQAAATVFEHLARLIPANPAKLSDVALITENLKLQLDARVVFGFRHELARLYQAVREERMAVSIDVYLEVRRTVGRLTADLSYLLISPLLEGEKKSLRSFMQQVGAVGCLVDSVIDFNADRHRGLLSFVPTTTDYVKLVAVALFEGLSIGARHPRLAGLFARAILDNVRDRFVATADAAHPTHVQCQVGR
jgi:hypothetical protein